MVRFTDVEYALVSCSAEQAGYPVAVYVRKQAITEKLHVHYNIVADIAELRDFARQLSHTSSAFTVGTRCSLYEGSSTSFFRSLNVIIMSTFLPFGCGRSETKNAAKVVPDLPVFFEREV